MTQATLFVTDDGQSIYLIKDSLAMVAPLVRAAVWRWCWRRVEEEHLHPMQADGGYGTFVQLVLQLLKSWDEPEGGPQWRAYLRPAFL